MNMWRILLVALLACGPFGVGCFTSRPGIDAGTDATDTGAETDGGTDAGDVSIDPGTDATDGGGDGGDGSVRGGCRSAADCMGRPCHRVPDVPGGWGFCERVPKDEATSCTGSFDECCSSAECTAAPGGGCFYDVRRYCGGPVGLPSNTCEYDQCSIDSQCGDANGLCLPRSVNGNPRRACLFVDCGTNGDCTLRAGGECLPFGNPCCGRPGDVATFSCVYAGDPCRMDADCPAGRSCLPTPTGSRCDYVACPL